MNQRVGDSRVAFGVLSVGLGERTELLGALELRVDGVNGDWALAALRTGAIGLVDMQLNGTIKNELALAGIVGSAGGAAVALAQGEVDALRSGGDALLLVEGQAAGFHVDLAVGDCAGGLIAR